MGKEVHDDAKGSDGDGLTVVVLRRSRVEADAGGVPGLSTRRPYGVFLRTPDGAAVNSSRSDAIRCIRTTQRADGAEGNLGGTTCDGSTRGPCVMLVSVFVPSTTGASASKGSGEPPRGRGSPRRAAREEPSP